MMITHQKMICFDFSSYKPPCLMEVSMIFPSAGESPTFSSHFSLGEVGVTKAPSSRAQVAALPGTWSSPQTPGWM
jgi:hypothetical protein